MRSSERGPSAAGLEFEKEYKYAGFVEVSAYGRRASIAEKYCVECDEAMAAALHRGAQASWGSAPCPKVSIELIDRGYARSIPELKLRY